MMDHYCQVRQKRCLLDCFWLNWKCQSTRVKTRLFIMFWSIDPQPFLFDVPETSGLCESELSGFTPMQPRL